METIPQEDFNEQLNKAIRNTIAGPVRRYEFDSFFDGKAARVIVEVHLKFPGYEILTAHFKIEK